VFFLFPIFLFFLNDAQMTLLALLDGLHRLISRGAKSFYSRSVRSSSLISDDGLLRKVSLVAR
jgi:hypothetical protein